MTDDELGALIDERIGKALAANGNNAVESPYWGAEDVAKHFGVTSRTINNWTRTEGLPFQRFGGALRFRRAEVEAWAAERGKR